MDDNTIRKAFVGFFAFLMLGAAFFMWIFGCSNTNELKIYYSLCCKTGPVLFLMWIAWDHLIKLPRWAYTSLPIVLIAALVNRRLLLVAIPVAVLISLLNHPWLLRMLKGAEKKERRK
ncbi:MAG: hypothetical protein Q4D38_02650 [Planctomycetia bacterium]|nr:hypothetical protein [Planctomycetia bacterium]